MYSIHGLNYHRQSQFKCIHSHSLFLFFFLRTEGQSKEFKVVFNLEYSFNVLLSRPINALHQFLASTSTVSVYHSLYSVIVKASPQVEYVQC